MTVAAIAERFELEFEGDGDLNIDGVCGISDDLSNHLSFVKQAAHVDGATASDIPAFVTRHDIPIPGKTCLFHDHPEYAIARIAALFVVAPMRQDEAVHASAVLGDNVTLGDGVVIGPRVVIGDDVAIGEATVIMAGSVVMNEVSLGAGCMVYPNCTIRERSVLGNRVILQPGAVIGADGYGFVRHDGHHHKIPQVGHVVIEDDVEVGANSTIDRGRFTRTRIGRGTKIDNLVMVAHNVDVGEDCLLVAQTGISGSTRLGDRVTLAGQVGIVGHLDITDDVTVLGQSMVTKSLSRPGIYAGSPAKPADEWRRAMAAMYRQGRRR
ncbi:MAG: UDP-3-O-(3-hydroxymyristoyl)glucosamine N-acyltransferase [Gammaproteobacteria bacterium]|nr:UDP-3-O-(3-hydroxymyristoyl)glucosamine N-acyltransferase [Gammaproteobacteria bacterium]